MIVIDSLIFGAGLPPWLFILKMQEVAVGASDAVQASFNEIVVIVRHDDSRERLREVCLELERKLDERIERGRNDPERITARKRIEEKAQLRIREGHLPFTVSKPVEWKRALREHSANDSVTTRFAARWAHHLEANLRQGVAFREAGSRALDQADKEEAGVGNVTVGLAASILMVVTPYGGEIRQWNDARMQRFK